MAYLGKQSMMNIYHFSSSLSLIVSVWLTVCLAEVHVDFQSLEVAPLCKVENRINNLYY